MRLVRPTEADRDDVRAKFAAARAALASALIERDDEVDVALTALVANEHALLVGPPGCAKSLLLDSLLALTGGAKFAVLLTKFSVPEEVVGPISLSALKADRYIRVTAGKLPDAEYAFVDEVFKASSAILNTLLKVLNERVFDAGDGPRPVPLKLCVAASNERPGPDTGKELTALFDRFLLRAAVNPVRTAAGRKRLLWGTVPAPAAATPPLTPADVDHARASAAALPWSADARDALEAVLKELAKEGVRPGDRRQRKTVGAVRAFAYLNGAEEVRPEHLEVARHCLWDDPQGQPQVAARVIARVANPAGMRVAQLLLEADQVAAAADARDLAGSATAAAKLGEIDRQLSVLGGDARADRARAHVRGQLKALKLASIEAL